MIQNLKPDDAKPSAPAKKEKKLEGADAAIDSITQRLAEK